jgi:U3 small nucleolar RNA-associated protein 11
MGKGGARKVKQHGWVEDPNAKEDKNGETRRWEGKAFKWKAERKR